MMKRIDLEFIIDGMPVKAVTTFAFVNEFALKLTEPEFSTAIASLHIPVFALKHSRFLDSSLNMTEKGLEHAQTMTERLFRAYQQVYKFQDDIDRAIVKTIELNIPKRELYYHTIAKMRKEKTVLKQELNEYSKNHDNQNRNETTKQIMANKKAQKKLKDDIIDSELDTLIENANKISGLFVNENDSTYSVNEVIINHILGLYNAKMQKINYETLTTSMSLDMRQITNKFLSAKGNKQ